MKGHKQGAIRLTRREAINIGLGTLLSTAVSVLALLAVGPGQVLAADFYVGGDGASDRNPGTASRPFATIQKAADVAAAGDFVNIRSGIYRETVVPANSGAPGQPVTFQPDGDAEITVSGADLVDGDWTVYNGQIYQTPIVLPVTGYGDKITGNETLLANQVFVGGKMMIEARWPNLADSDDLLNRADFRPIPKDAWTAGPGGTAILRDAGIPEIPGGWAGGTIWYIGWYMPQTSTIAASSAGQVEFPSKALEKFRDSYYLTGKLGALDAEKEWFYDGSKLYLWAPGGGAPENVEVKRRNHAFDLSGKSNITIRNIRVFAATITTDATSADITLDGLRATYISHFVTVGAATIHAHRKESGVRLMGPRNAIRNSIVAYSAGTGIALGGEGCVADNNLVHDISYAGTYGCGIWPAPGSARQTITRNTIYRTGRSGIDGVYSNKDIGYNDIFAFGLINTDLGAIYVANGADLTGSRIHHNWLHDAGNDAGHQYPVGAGIYFDQNAKPARIDHNVFWNNHMNDVRLEQDKPPFHRVFNNTLASTDVKYWFAFHSYPGGSPENLNNNIYRAPIKPDKPGTHEMTAATDPKFTNVGAGGLKFRLRPDSPAIDRGVVIPGVTEGYKGTAPDLGAYEYGGTDWVAGCTLSENMSPARASGRSQAEGMHHREHNLLLDATLSGNMDSFNVGLRRFDGGECQPKFLVYDFKKQDFLGFSRWISHKHKRLAIKTDVYAYGVKKDADLGVVLENNAAYWMAEWPAPVSANFITLMGSYPHEASQANTAWKIELRSNGTWSLHGQGVGGWYDRGQYFWGGRDVEPVQFDGLRVRLFSKDETTPLKNIHFRAQENGTWMVAYLPPIDAQIVVKQQVPRAGQVVNLSGNQVFGTVQSWQWDFGDGKSATGQRVSHTFADAGTYDVTLTLSGAGQTVNIVDRVTIHPAIKAQITPLPGPVLEGNDVTFDASHSYGSIGAYHWDFGDGTTVAGRTVTKSFGAAGIYRVTLTVSNSTGSNSCSALVRVHTPATVNVPQVLLDSDVEEDDIYTIAYALCSELDILGMTAVHHGGEEPGAVKANYDRILHIIDLARQSGLPAARQPRAFRGADEPLIPPYSDNWRDTEPIVTEASEAILAAARGASPDNPVWVVSLGPISNCATAILQARREGWEAEFRQRIRVFYVGSSFTSTRVATWNGRRDAWAAHIVAQSGVEFWIMLEPVAITLKWDRREMKDRYPKNPLGDYLYQISPDRNAGWYDPTALAAVISMHANRDWFSNVEGVTVGGRYQNYRFASTTARTSVRLIRNIDADAMRNDIFETLNGRPTKLRDSNRPFPHNKTHTRTP